MGVREARRRRASGQKARGQEKAEEVEMGRRCHEQVEGFGNWRPTVWRIHLNPTDGEDPPQLVRHPVSVEYALLNGVVGAGWRLLPEDEVPEGPECFNDYREKAVKRYGEKPLGTFELAKLKPGDLVWFLVKPHKKGLIKEDESKLLLEGYFQDYVLYIALVVGFWEYQNTPLAQVTDMMAVVPVLHLRAFTMEKESGERVADWGDFSPEPGDEGLAAEIAQRCKQVRTLQPIVSPEELIAFSKRVWYQLSYRRRAHFRVPSDLPPFIP